MNRVVGDKVRVVRVRSGVARGARLALDLSREKAYWLGTYERDVQALLRENVHRGDVVFDVGAHVGFFSVCAAALGARVVAVEPDPANAARLRRNAALNGAPIEVVEAAAWSADGTVELVAGDSAKEFRTVPGSGVASVTLDTIADRHGRPALLKLDVEGAEAEALRGGARVLAENKPVLLCELHGDEARRDVLALLGGYEVADVGGPTRIVARPKAGA